MDFPRNDGYKQKTSSSVRPGDQSSAFWHLPLGEDSAANPTGRQGTPDFTGAGGGFQKPPGGCMPGKVKPAERCLVCVGFSRVNCRGSERGRPLRGQ